MRLDDARESGLALGVLIRDENTFEDSVVWGGCDGRTCVRRVCDVCARCWLRTC